MSHLVVPPLSESLGLPDVFPHLPGCEEDALTQEKLQHGYRHSEAAAVGFSSRRELSLTLTDQPPSFYSPASLAYWRKSLHHQLLGPSRQLAAKRKAHVIYDQPLGASLSSTRRAASGPGAAQPDALALAGAATLPPPRFPLQSSRGAAGKEAAEAWAREQLAAPGAPLLRTLGWVGRGEGGQVPHGFPRTRQLELLAELEIPMPRALWFLRVTALNRARPPGWDGATEAQQRSRQLTEELLTFLEATVPSVITQGAVPARPGRPGAAGGQEQQQALQGGEGSKTVGQDGECAEVTEHAMPAQWRYVMVLAGHCCSAGLLDGARAAEWAASSRVLLPLPAAGRQQVLSLLAQCMHTTPLAQQQVVALMEQCLKSSQAAAAAASAAAAATKGTAAPGADAAAAAGMPASEKEQHLRKQREAEALQRGLLQVAEQLLALHPAAFVSAHDDLLLPLHQANTSNHNQNSGGRGGIEAGDVAGWVGAARRRLSRALHARVLHWHDANAMQLLDEQLPAGSSAPEGAAALLKLVSQQAGAAAEGGEEAATDAGMHAVRVVCNWALMSPASDFGAALALHTAAIPALGQQLEQDLQQQRQEQEQQAVGAGAMLPERVHFGLAVLQALATSQPQQQRDAGGPLSHRPPLQAALQCWLAGCAQEQRARQQWQLQRLLHWVLLLAEAGLFCPEVHLQSCLAAGAFQPAAGPHLQGSTGEGGGRSDNAAGLSTTAACTAELHLLVLEQLHPLLEHPTLTPAPGGGGTASARSAGGGRMDSGGSGAVGGRAWSLARLRYAAARTAVLQRYGKAVVGVAATAAAGSAGGGGAADGEPWAELDSAEEMQWEQLMVPAGSRSGTPSPCRSSSGIDGSTDNSQAVRQGVAQQIQMWQDPNLQHLQQLILGLLGLDAQWAAPHYVGTGGLGSDGAAGGDPAALGPLLRTVQQLEPWQQRHTASALVAAAKSFLGSTDAGGTRSSPHATPSPAPASAPAPVPAQRHRPPANWLLHALAVLRACCGHREALSLLATCLNLLQRAVAGAVRLATTGPGGQAQPLPDALEAAQRGWQQRSGVPPPLLLALLSAHAGPLAASDIAAKLLPMLTGGLWRLQQPADQQAAKRCLAGQLDLAAHILSLPGSSPQEWLGKMRRQHGDSHWALGHLQQQAAALKASRGSGGSQQQAAQQTQRGVAALDAFMRKAALLSPMLQPSLSAVAAAHSSPDLEAGGHPQAAIGSGASSPATQQQQQQQQHLLFLAPQPSDGGDADTTSAAATLAAMQHSLTPAALSALLKQLAGAGAGASCAWGLHQHLATLMPAASRALLSSPQQAYDALSQHQQRMHATAAVGSPASAPWQLALALFASSSGFPATITRHLLQLSSGEAMSAAVAAATPATSRWAWLLLRLVLDDEQQQGGHRLAEAERQLAQRAVHQAVFRPEAAAALAATLCSLSPWSAAAAGQQMLQEVEGLLRPPVVCLTQNVAAAASGARRPRVLIPLSASGTMTGFTPAVPAVPFGGEQGLVDAALVCLSTGSSADGQHSFAQQLINQLAALADCLQTPPHGPQHQHVYHQQQQQQQQVQLAGHAQLPGMAAAAAAASPAAVQVSVWVRLALLLPLLPLVYKHRSADGGGGLRGQLLRALLCLLAAPAIRADAATAAQAAKLASSGSGAQQAQGDAEAAAAAAAAAAAGEPLPQRLLHLLRALLLGGWASWMRLQGGKLRDVPAYEHSRQLAAEAAALPLPPALQAAVTAALPLNQQQGLVPVPTCQPVADPSLVSNLSHQPASSTNAAGCIRALDPWLLLEGGTQGGHTTDTQAAAPPASASAPTALAAGAAQPPQTATVPPWLAGAVKRRRRDLCYMPTPDTSAGPPVSITEQLLGGKGGSFAAALAANRMAAQWQHSLQS